MTSLSPTTVSGIISSLAELKVVSETYTNAKKGERRQAAYYIRSSYYACVADVSGPVYRFYIARGGRAINCVWEYNVRSSLDFAENMSLFAEGVNRHLNELNCERCAGICLLLPGGADTNEYYDTFKSALSKSYTVHTSDSRTIRARYVSKDINESSSVFMLFIDHAILSSCITAGGSKNFSFANFGLNLKTDTGTLQDTFLDSCNVEELITLISDVIADVRAAVPFSHLCITGNYIPSMNILSEMIYEDLSQRMSQVCPISCPPDTDVFRNVTNNLLHTYFMDIILGK